MAPAPKLDISPGDLKIVLDILARHVPDREVWAFGSRATWKTKDFSDLDLAVIGEEPLSLKVSAALSDDFAESDLPFKVDVVDWATTSESFRGIIRRDRVVVRDSEPANDWPSATLGDVVEMFSGGTPSKGRADYWIGDIPWVSAKDMKSFRLENTEDHLSEEGAANGTRQMPTGSVLILVRGMTLLNDVPICVLSRRMAFNQDIKGLRARGGLCPELLPYVLTANKGRLLGMVDLAGHGTGRINTDELKALNVTLPPMAEQRRIAAILGALDDKIDLNRRMNETLEAMARALFKSWFVDFDPVRAKRDGQQPDGMDEETARLFPAETDDNDIPLGWSLSTIGAEVRVVGGSTPSTKDATYWDGGHHHWVTPKDLSNLTSPILLHSERKLTDSGVAQISSGLLPVGSVLLSSRAPIGYLAVTEIPTAINQGFIGMICDSQLPKLHVYEWCRQNMDLIKSHANGSTFMEISKAAFRPLPVIVPEPPILAAYQNFVGPLFEKVVSNLKESETLAALRDLLLPRLLSGQLRIKDAEKMVADAV